MLDDIQHRNIVQPRWSTAKLEHAPHKSKAGANSNLALTPAGSIKLITDAKS